MRLFQLAALAALSSARFTQALPEGFIDATEFSPYPNYSGSLRVTGIVVIGHVDNRTQTLSFHFLGADPACTSSADLSVKNACGVHIHAGATCQNAGGHLFDSSVGVDPWLNVVYTAGASGTTQGSGLRVTTGIHIESMVGNATFVVHDVAGGRVACAEFSQQQLTPEQVLVGPFQTYPGSSASMTNLGGAVKLLEFGSRNFTAQMLDYDLPFYDAACESADITGVANACGIHVHAGLTCASGVGGHYHSGSTDPWPVAVYKGKAGRTPLVVTGEALSYFRGRTLVVHDVSGARIGCAKVPPVTVSDFSKLAPLRAGNFTPHPTYQGSLRVRGTVWVGQDGEDTQVLAYDLTGVDPACKASGGTACGIHMHSYSASGVGDPLFSASLPSNPWLPVRYAASGGAASAVNVRVTTGLPISSLRGAIVVMDAKGEPVAWAPLEPAEMLPGWTLGESWEKYPGYAGALTASGEVVIRNVGDKGLAQFVAFHLEGVDAACGVANITGVANACGIHVHAGKSCAVAAEVGGHYWNKTAQETDPWLVVGYVAPGGKAAGITTPIATGVSSVQDRTFVVHDSTGARIACHRIGSTDTTRIQMSTTRPSGGSGQGGAAATGGGSTTTEAANSSTAGEDGGVGLTDGAAGLPLACGAWLLAMTMASAAQ